MKNTVKTKESSIQLMRLLIHLIGDNSSLEFLNPANQEKGRRMRWLNGITNSMDEFEQASVVGDGQGSLASYSPWGHRVGHN